MEHDALCQQRYQPYENDEHCHDCHLIEKVLARQLDAFQEAEDFGYFVGVQDCIDVIAELTEEGDYVRVADILAVLFAIQRGAENE